MGGGGGRHFHIDFETKMPEDQDRRCASTSAMEKAGRKAFHLDLCVCVLLPHLEVMNTISMGKENLLSANAEGVKLFSIKLSAPGLSSSFRHRGACTHRASNEGAVVVPERKTVKEFASEGGVGLE